ncbi:MAG: rhodanese-like domain-containing protein [Fibrobacteria bacterium]|nr:rhodanese-like domain-containing protein [Fibrobacteria bacterium]
MKPSFTWPTILLAFVMGCGGAASAGGDLSPTQADSLIRAHSQDTSFLLIDVRTPGEFASGHIPGARMIDFHAPDFQSRVESLPRTAPILLYCRSGNRSGQALSWMETAGFTQVRHLSGGVRTWMSEGRPLAR